MTVRSVSAVSPCVADSPVQRRKGAKESLCRDRAAANHEISRVTGHLPLEGDAQATMLHRGSHLQIVAQRFAQLMAGGADPMGIVAFTFTERAGDVLKVRISARVEERLGAASIDNLGTAFVGTIDSYWFRLLRQHAPYCETFDHLTFARRGRGQRQVVGGCRLGGPYPTCDVGATPFCVATPARTSTRHCT
jgi:hypothetical protein